jgi:hypothetical protein
MQARGYTELTTTELPDELLFTVVHHYGWLDQIVGVILSLVFLIYFLGFEVWKHHERWAPFFDAFVVFVLLLGIRARAARWLSAGTEKLSIKESEITATGRVGSLFQTKMTVTASELREPGCGLAGGIQFGVPVELKYSDFRLKSGGKSRRVLEGLDQAQKKVVSDLIFKRFPAFSAGARGPASVLFGDQAGIATLGLSDSPRDSGLK